VTGLPTAERDRWRMFRRGLVKRCANCGGGRLFTGWFTMRDRCPTCGYKFERQEGLAVGGMGINIIVTEALFGIFLLTALVVTIPDVPVLPLVLVGLAMNLLIPIAFYPFSKSIWAAIELMMRPLEPHEELDAMVNRPQSG
jgi:uncharacterized protein (DUF983 family)